MPLSQSLSLGGAGCVASASVFSSAGNLSPHTHTLERAGLETTGNWLVGGGAPPGNPLLASRAPAVLLSHPPWGCPETPASQPLCGGQRGDKIQLPPYLGNGGGGWGCPRFRPISFQMLLLSFRIPGFGSWGEPSPLLSPAPALLFALLSPPPPPFPCQARQGLWPKPYGLSRVDNMLQFSLRQ